MGPRQNADALDQIEDVEKDSECAQKPLIDIELEGIDLGTKPIDDELVPNSPNPHDMVVAKGQEIHQANQNSTEQDSQSLRKKIHRSATLVQVGNHIHFISSGECQTHDAFVVDTKKSLEDSGDETERQIATSSHNFGRILNPTWLRSIINNPYSEASTCSRSSASVAEDDTKHEQIEDPDGRHEENRKGDKDDENENGCSDTEDDDNKAADERLELNHGVFNQAPTIARRGPPRETRDLRPAAGEELAVMGQADVEWHNVSPIPLNFYAPRGLKTPSTHSNGTEQDCESPLFPKSCKTVLMQAHRAFASNLEDDSSGPAIDSVDNNIDQTPPSLNETIFKWMSQTPNLSRLGHSDRSSLKGKDKVLDVLKDIQSDERIQKNSELRIASRKALKDISNLRGPGYLQHNSFVNETKTATGRDLKALTMEEPLDEPNKTEVFHSLNSYNAQHWPEASIAQKPSSLSGLAIARTALEGFVISSSSTSNTCSTSKVFEDAAEILLNDDTPSCVGDRAFALARLEGRKAPKPSSPIQVFVDPTWAYGNDVEVEDEVLDLLDPGPLHWFTMTRVAVQLEIVVKAWFGFAFGFGLDANIPEGYSATTDGDSVERPANPTPRRAQRQQVAQSSAEECSSLNS